MGSIDRSRPIMVTGATGYVAGWIVNKLLQEGFTVHAPVRDPDAHEKLIYLNRCAEKSPGHIRYFKADLLTEGSYDEAMKGCELVFHTASPFSNKVKNAQKDLVDPALNGTKNVLATVERTPEVKRVVLTSSCAAIYGDNKDLQSLPDKTLNESVWNTSSSVKHQAYSYSKTVAEKEAWHLVEQQKKPGRWDLVVVNPSLVIGPGINPFGTSESFNIVKQLGDGTMRMGAPDLEIGVVDVRDLAEAHFQAAFRPEAEGRHIISAETSSILALGKLLNKRFGRAYDFPKKPLPKGLVWLIGPLVGFSRKMVQNNLGYSWKADHSKSVQALGMHYRPVEESITAFFQQMIDHDRVSPH
jgi:nucleoside-diphosphate-sugar epimerase